MKFLDHCLQVANAAHTQNPTRCENTSVRGTKGSKRVPAPQEQDVPNRVTRQKTRDLGSNPDPEHGQILIKTYRLMKSQGKNGHCAGLSPEESFETHVPKKMKKFDYYKDLHLVKPHGLKVDSARLTNKLRYRVGSGTFLKNI